jgi:hypothetical protein
LAAADYVELIVSPGGGSEIVLDNVVFSVEPLQSE